MKLKTLSGIVFLLVLVLAGAWLLGGSEQASDLQGQLTGDQRDLTAQLATSSCKYFGEPVPVSAKGLIIGGEETWNGRESLWQDIQSNFKDANLLLSTDQSCEGAFEKIPFGPENFDTIANRGRYQIYVDLTTYGTPGDAPIFVGVELKPGQVKAFEALSLQVGS